MYKYVILVLFILIVLVLGLKNYYYSVIDKYFRNNDMIVYDYFIKYYIHAVSANNYFMNYGLWDNKITNLKQANKNLCDFIFSKAELNLTDDFSILDVGCGYGMQDLLWCNKISKSSTITAIDISKTQIDYANNIRRKKGISKKCLTFIECDAHQLLNKFECSKFNKIISLESAFHYKDRPLFFNNVSKLLTNDGTFVISDIVLNNAYKPSIITDLFIKLASDFLYIPQQNLIKLKKWKKQIKKSNLQILEIHDITDRTFIPYYIFFIEKYCEKKNLSIFILNFLKYILVNIQPFSYVIAVCKSTNNA